MSRWLIAFSVVCVGIPGSIDAALVDGDLDEFGITGVGDGLYVGNHIHQDLLVANSSLNNLQPNSVDPLTQYVDDWGGGAWTHVVLRVRR